MALALPRLWVSWQRVEVAGKVDVLGFEGFRCESLRVGGACRDAAQYLQVEVV
ncbi:MAG: hypothetical protein QOI14_1935, partial [Actinomycetota bacterium]|nr:hypothetical protein [Actinomycetota bacterium]